MSLKKRKPSVAFSWHKSFAILAPWRKGKGDMALENEVVLTKMKLFNNFQEKLLNAEDSVSTMSMSVSEQDVSAPLQAAEVISVHSAPPNMEESKSNKDYLSAIFSDSKLPSLYKFESEDSGVEMPSGANSPSTPTGSEHSFVVHSRESSCDSGTLNPPIPSSSPILLLEQSLENEQTSSTFTQEDLTELTALERRSEDQTDTVLMEAAGDSERSGDRTLGDISELHEDAFVCANTVKKTAESEADEDTRSQSHSIEAYDGNAGAESQHRPLRKSTTSDSLDEYMEECCRLSEVNQAQSNPLGSGLGYLEHICQLIEKIGQLQEHNLKLQKQICSLQKDSKMMKTKEDFFVQHCHCGAAGLAFQELKRYSRSDYHSLAASNGTLSDLSTIPEGTRIPHRSGGRDGEGSCQSVVPMWRRGLNRRSYTEGETRYLSGSAEVLPASHRRVESHTWGRVKDLMKKTRFRNQSRLGLSSGSLKRSCPQLYRPELGQMEFSRKDRNSMIVLGHQKLDYHFY